MLSTGMWVSEMAIAIVLLIIHMVSTVWGSLYLLFGQRGGSAWHFEILSIEFSAPPFEIAICLLIFLSFLGIRGFKYIWKSRKILLNISTKPPDRPKVNLSVAIYRNISLLIVIYIVYTWVSEGVKF